MTGDRFNEGKSQWSLVSFESIEPMVKVLEFGAKKYAPYNWAKGLKVTECTDSMMRHLTAFMKGEDNDPESGISHVGHIMCNAMFLEYMMKNRPDMDDRYKQECCGEWDKEGSCDCPNPITNQLELFEKQENKET